jgi:hypothetical protein
LQKLQPEILNYKKMKKILLMVAIMVSMTYAAKAQDGIAVGLKVGTNYSNVYDSEGQDFEADSKFGLAAGAFVSIPLGTYLGIQPEVLFSQKGFKGTGTMLGSSYDLTRTTNYIDVPLLIAVKPTGSITLLAGPQFSFLLKEKNVFSNSTTNLEQERQFDNDNIRKNTLCFTGGFDVNLDHTVIGLRAGWDLSNNNGNGTSSTPRYKNVWGQLTLGYRFYN